MAEDPKILPEQQPSVESYIAGFALSILLTVAAYTLVAGNFVSDSGVLTALILLLAIFQLWVQLKFFLHLGSRHSQRWNLVFFLSTAGIVFIVVIGSLWIMNHLNYNMTPGQMAEFIIHDERGHTQK